MTKKATNSGKQWTESEIHKMKDLVKGNTPTGLIAHELRRSEDSIRSKASQLSISLKPTNQSPYNRRKK
ncbi:MAG: hypothetical protein PHY48_14055 [Candidatus Cloacimonetes bacterium]|nr:hypothetical protein [Candidatus Cloacimonadota bacterium]